MVQPAVRRNVVLPNEILRKIFALVLEGSSARSKAIDLKYYGLLARIGMLGKLMRVDYHFAVVAVAVFYEVNGFDFWKFHPGYRNETYPAINEFGCRMPPALPPLWAHEYLRQIRIVVHLSDKWWDDTFGAWCTITSADDLIRYCPGARILQLLTTSMTNLRSLDLQIEELFQREEPLESCAVYRSAGFQMHAKEIKFLIVEPRTGLPRKDSDHWYPELANAIGL
ncbi:hypothetical protein CFE70_002547 [Pyrenophora teres f. teres 0-1]|uniref:Uncharacterized protein n=2 Tax=Pyrenophora teres f. teres TaxID=97479 RepID=E3RJS4_PYRTT|nr:hypothetical protein PTT_08435 [Pyrenophora teres f. teres 0-1]KAE8843105.1 hypothetical protein HRS9139_02402 [Pyrenophora teres f. teres]KAE8849838.1 hypothetical protein PTNB85_00254 [Pyrenophora teres f. teres]KAE8852136.1 hypothetical protein HRS9122_02423 [Pyrenophora teres f. teres]KAE8870807.1 hypothetical protein PTNB29_01151 [Pyrenophora teres f. teres]